jgi:hypothetical protein
LKIQRGFSEIFIPRLHKEEYSTKFYKLYGAYSISGNTPFEEREFTNIADNHRRNSNREAVFKIGEIFKYKEGECDDVIEWIFAPGIGWKNIPEEAIEEMNKCNCLWNYFGKVREDENYADQNSDWRNNFFIMKSSGEWKYMICPNL